MKIRACIMLKEPRPGTVKTRLAADLGTGPATELYRALVERQLGEIPPSWHPAIHYTPTDAEPAMRSWLGRLLPSDPTFAPQTDGDLGARMAHAAERAITDGADAVMILGGDCPGLTRGYLLEAENALIHSDLVIAPARDGGYVLLGLKRPHPELFRSIDWSTDRVLAQTLAAADRSSLSTRLLPPLDDIDDLPSYHRNAHLLPVI